MLNSRCTVHDACPLFHAVLYSPGPSSTIAACRYLSTRHPRFACLRSLCEPRQKALRRTRGKWTLQALHLHLGAIPNLHLSWQKLCNALVEQMS